MFELPHFYHYFVSITLNTVGFLDNGSGICGCVVCCFGVDISCHSYLSVRRRCSRSRRDSFGGSGSDSGNDGGGSSDSDSGSGGEVVVVVVVVVGIVVVVVVVVANCRTNHKRVSNSLK